MQELPKVKMFAGLNDEDLSTIQWVGEERNIEADAVVFAENSPGKCLYVLLEGLVEIIVANPVKKDDPILFGKDYAPWGFRGILPV